MKKNEIKKKKDGDRVRFFDKSADNIITLRDDEGRDARFYEIACVETDGELYALLQPETDLPDIAADEAAVFQITEDENGEAFAPAKSRAVMERVFAIYAAASDD